MFVDLLIGAQCEWANNFAYTLNPKHNIHIYIYTPYANTNTHTHTYIYIYVYVYIYIHMYHISILPTNNQ